MISYRLSSVLGVMLIAALGLPTCVQAQSDPYHITKGERAACTGDAIRLCSSAYPDEGKLLSCMSANRASLSRTCLAAFDAGLKRRRIVMR